MAEPQAFCVFDTEFGHCALAWSGSHIIGLQLPGPDAGGTADRIAARFPNASRCDDLPEPIDQLVADIRRYFAGERVDFNAVPIALSGHDLFFHKVYGFIRTLGWGETTTYGAIAKALDAGPEAARDVGQAMAKNPLPLILPCHRVLAAGNRIGGFSAPGGSDTKRQMLALEGVHLAPPKPVQQSLDL